MILACQSIQSGALNAMFSFNLPFLPCIWLRFNTDKYTIDGVQVDIDRSGRDLIWTELHTNYELLDRLLDLKNIVLNANWGMLGRILYIGYPLDANGMPLVLKSPLYNKKLIEKGMVYVVVIDGNKVISAYPGRLID